jgi:hypothetical protein
MFFGTPLRLVLRHSFFIQHPMPRYDHAEPQFAHSTMNQVKSVDENAGFFSESRARLFLAKSRGSRVIRGSSVGD